MNNTTSVSRENWSSYMGFIFAAIGSAVGIGNIGSINLRVNS
ncbi:hypothetical protein BH23THE1_BH23THE1_17530 [soil metagenome]